MWSVLYTFTGLTQDTLVLVPLTILVVYVALTLIRAFTENAKRLNKEEEINHNAADITKQESETQDKLFRSPADINKCAKEVSGTLSVPT